ncbi:MAG: Low molecular weight protein-tyrosine-phosphatase wzb [Firmicutes bacterium ADurb.BinA052]|jgi:protein-tyrosine-phosphatase|nr:MAG: Low molecular weight protein-tyrosine-phosphatase wzb [Firmicutes bacterium ADurb.BinA052]
MRANQAGNELFSAKFIAQAVNEMPRRILIVCGGNTCRSAMAEAMARKLIESGPCADDWAVESAGAGAVEGDPATDNAVAVLAELGLDLAGHRARLLAPEMVSRADIILTMERRHLERVLELDPLAAPRARMLAQSDIADPFGCGIEVYRRTRDEIQHSLAAWLGSWSGGGD